MKILFLIAALMAIPAQAETVADFTITKTGFIAERGEVFVGYLTKEGPQMGIGCSQTDKPSDFYIVVGPVVDFFATKDCMVAGKPSCGSGLAFKVKSIHYKNMKSGEEWAVSSDGRSCTDGLLFKVPARQSDHNLSDDRRVTISKGENGQLEITFLSN